MQHTNDLSVNETKLLCLLALELKKTYSNFAMCTIVDIFSCTKSQSIKLLNGRYVPCKTTISSYLQINIFNVLQCNNVKFVSNDFIYALLCAFLP